MDVKKPKLLFHIPHSSTVIPDDIRKHFSLQHHQLDHQVKLLTDWYTSDLFSSAVHASGIAIEFPISRIVVDPERFEIDSLEPMSKVGMGVLYTKTAHGHLLRAEKFTQGRYRTALIDTYYKPHHETLTRLVQDQIDQHQQALIIDCHSFPTKALPYEMDQTDQRPDICIGTDGFHTPSWLAHHLDKAFEKLGYSVAINSPFSGSLVPLEFYGKHKSVYSIMIEINRSLYMNEENLKRTERFNVIKADIADVIRDVSNALHHGNVM